MLVFDYASGVRQCVKFEQGNVLEERFADSAAKHTILSSAENSLIYFDNEAQGQALKSLRQILTADGLLFVGSAEAGLLSQHGFSDLEIAYGVCFSQERVGCFPDIAETETTESSVALEEHAELKPIASQIWHFPKKPYLKRRSAKRG